MDWAYQVRLQLEDDLYQEDEGDSEGSEVGSELEFHLYSQLHYSSNPGELEEQEEQEDGEKKECQDSQQDEVVQRGTDHNGDLNHSLESKPSSGKLQKHQKKKTKKGKRKRDGEGLKSSLPCFEEVIVIDSGPDVISISEESSEDDEGICSVKGQGSQRQQTSTPAQQVNQRKIMTIPALVTVDSSSPESQSDSDESESESEPDSSDSDDLETWMILGRGDQDEDHSISLNVQGGSNSTDTEEGRGQYWLVSNRDKEAQIYNKDKGPRITSRAGSNRYYTEKNVHCRNCNKTGHLSRSCPNPKLVSCLLCGNPGHISRECPNKHCNNCGLPGHLYNSCREKPTWYKQCHRCGKKGHFLDACPEIWRQYCITTKAGPPVKLKATNQERSRAYCYNCSKKGHFGHECTRQKMFNGIYPCSPFVHKYDTMNDINKRQLRIQKRVEELKKTGSFHGLYKAPLIPGPPTKKQKNSHQKSNKNNHAPHQTPKKHKPNSSHIFFNDDEEEDVIDATPKASKSRKQQESICRSAKPWKPKRPVPTSRDQRPPNKLRPDEADDFPRGGGRGESMKEKKRRRKKKTKPAPLALTGGHRDDRPSWTANKKHQQPEWKEEKKKKKKRTNQTGRAGAHTYPTDEDLFMIKQRKRSR